MEINSHIIKGKIVSDVIVTEYRKGMYRANFSVLWSDYRGQELKQTFFNVVAFGQLAQRAKRLKKGTMVIIECEIIGQQYIDQQGNKKFVHNWILKDIKKTKTVWRD